MKQYLELLQTIIDKGTYKAPARENMPGTTSVFGYQMRFNLQEGFPLLTTKKMYWKGIVIELLWFLRGDTNIKFLLDNGVNIWNEDSYNYYVKYMSQYDGITSFPDDLGIKIDHKRGESGYRLFTFTEFVDLLKNKSLDQLESDHNYGEYTLGQCGFQYGKVWRFWKTRDGSIDQIENLIKGLKNNPEGRRHIVTAWDPGHDQDLALTWCHAMFQMNCRKLTLAQRLDHAKNLQISFHEGYGEKYYLELCEHYNIPKYYLDCHMYQRSADVVLGVPFNIASYALLTEIIAKICNMIPGDFIHSFGDVHIYGNHMEAVKEQLQRTPKELSKLNINSFTADCLTKYGLDATLEAIDESKANPSIFFELSGYDPYPKLESDTELSTGLKK